MTNTNLINEAAALIAEFNPSAAAIFRAQPFNRAAIGEAFEAGFVAHSDYTRKVCAFVRAAVRADRIDRQIAEAA